jgi:hypothetical protein
MLEHNETVSEKDKLIVITKMVLNLMKRNAAGVHRPPRFIAFNVN